MDTRAKIEALLDGINDNIKKLCDVMEEGQTIIIGGPLALENGQIFGPVVAIGTRDNKGRLHAEIVRNGTAHAIAKINGRLTALNWEYPLTICAGDTLTFEPKPSWEIFRAEEHGDD